MSGVRHAQKIGNFFTFVCACASVNPNVEYTPKEAKRSLNIVMSHMIACCVVSSSVIVIE